jgi:CRP/FNR family transcriptional regulator, nitrogen oxide reductase regulator
MDTPRLALRSRIFDGLTDAERDAWLRAARPGDFRRGQAVARQGETAGVFSLVETGLLKLSQVTPDGRELIVRFVGPGEPFGGVAALDGVAYPVTALAAAPTRLWQWPRDTLVRLLEVAPLVRQNLTREMAEHMTDALTRVRELATERVGQRLAHTLLRLMRQCGEPTPHGVLIAHPLTRQELAELTGTTLYTVSRTLSRWQSDGVIEASSRRLLIRSATRLEALARAEG